MIAPKPSIEITKTPIALNSIPSRRHKRNYIWKKCNRDKKSFN